MKLKEVLKYFILWIIGGTVYIGIELLYRQRTHWTMFIVGGLCFIFCGALNEVMSWDTLIWKQMLYGTLGITFIEFISGCIINLWLGMSVWDYSNLPFNILGQVCLLFSIFWYFLSLLAIVLDDYLRYWMFKEEKPHYRFK